MVERKVTDGNVKVVSLLLDFEQDHRRFNSDTFQRVVRETLSRLVCEISLYEYQSLSQYKGLCPDQVLFGKHSMKYKHRLVTVYNEQFSGLTFLDYLENIYVSDKFILRSNNKNYLTVQFFI